MRTSLIKLHEIEEFLSGHISTENRIVFEANLMLDNELVADVKNQLDAYTIIKLYGRQNLKTELEILHARLVTDPKNKSFRDHIFKIFKKN